MEWIKIDKDNRPSFGEAVLVCSDRENYEPTLARLESVTENAEGLSYSWIEGHMGYDTFVYDVTHYMPRPKSVFAGS